MLKRIFHYFKSRPGLTILLLLLGLITFANLNPNFFLLGWDNYSSYFNLKTNIFHTFFATWRQYRGLGVPSDSESTDIFRQLFFFVISPFVKTQLLDQIYILFALNCGVISMYFLAKTLMKKLFHKEFIYDIIGSSSAMIYLFNLNTLATFYFPMIMFVNRFYSIPLILLLLTKIIEKGKHANMKDYLLLSIIIIITSGSYMTATVFITFLLVLALFLLFQGNSIVHKLTLFVFIVGLGSFWLFPFANYTIQKSQIVYDAPTFIEANEIQLNKQASFYSLEKQLILYPSFFETPISNLNRTQITGYHPILASLNNPAVRLYVVSVSILMIIGSIMIFLRFKKHKHLLWIPLVYFLFLLLSLKAYSPVGFVYVLLEKNIPLFSNLFRFGDTKFHFFMAMTGSLSIGYLFGFIASKFSKKIIISLIMVIFLCGLFVYRDYVTGHLFGFFMKSQIPPAYFQIAKVMNDDKREGRVLHLPYDNNGYWRSYSWGYLGSSFLHFMIDRPLFEKTFEPASTENAEINKKIFEHITSMQTVRELNTEGNKINETHQFLKKIGVRYIIFDGTISSDQPSKGVSLWGQFNSADSRSTVSGLEAHGFITKVSEYNINLSDYLNAYEKQFSLSNVDLTRVRNQPNQTISLYEVVDPEPQIKITNEQILQQKQYPFQNKQTNYVINNGVVESQLKNIFLKGGTSYSLSLPQSSQGADQTQLEIYGRSDKDKLYLTFLDSPIPEFRIGESILKDKQKIKEIAIPLKLLKNRLSIRLKIGDTIIPIPILSSVNQFVGALTVSRTMVPIEILIPSITQNIDPSNIRLTAQPNCFVDAISNYTSSREVGERGNVIINSQNGSTCFLADLSTAMKSTDSYLELQMDYEAQSRDLDKAFSSTSKPLLENMISSLPKPNNLYACIKDEAVADCYNTHQVFDLSSTGSITIPTEKSYSAYHPLVLFALKNTGLEAQQISIKKLSTTSYQTVFQDAILLANYGDRTYTITPEKDTQLALRFHAPLNNSSFYQGATDGFLLSNAPCTKPGSYRTFRKQGDTLLSYFNNCDNSLSTTLDFNSENMYLWLVDYRLDSGKFPRFTLGDGFFNYKNEYFSQGQGYPTIPGFKEFQYPETLFSNIINIKRALSSSNLVQTFTLIPPHPEYQDKGKKGFTITQDSENEGVVSYQNFTVMPLPNRWYSMAIEEIKNTEENTGASVQYSHILPSLWKIQVQGNGVIKFNESYDKQWGVYANMKDIILGKELPNKHVRCDDYFNCFTLEKGEAARYIFYWPEKLNLLGWGVTILTALLFSLFGRRAS